MSRAPSHRTFRSVVAAIVLGAAMVVAWTVGSGLSIINTGAADLDDLTIVSGTTGDIVLDDASTFGDVTDVIDALNPDADVTVAVPELSGLPAGLIANSAVAVANDDVDGAASVALLGNFAFTDVDGLSFDGVRLAVVATWENATAAGPEVAVLLNLADQSAAAENRVNLSRMLGVATDIPLGSLIIGVGSDGYEVVPFDDEDDADPNAGAFSSFLDDGNDATDDTVPLAGGPAALNLLLAGGVLDDAAEELESADGVRLAGSLTDTNGLALLNGGAAPSIEAFSVTASIAASTPSYFPEWVDIGGTWTFSASYDGATVSGAFAGGITITPDGDTEATAEFSAAFSVGADPSFEFEATFTNITGLFGQDWFELSTATLAGTVSADGFGASFEGEFALAGATGTMAFSIEASGADIAVSATLDADFDDLSAAGIIGAIDDSLSIDDAILDVQINSVSLAVDFSKVGGDTELYVGLFGSTSLTIGGATPNVDLLFRVAFVDGDVSLYGAAKASGLNLADIDPIVGDFDWTLPELTIIVSTDAADPVPFADLDGPTSAFFASILCEDPNDVDTCVDFEVVQGVELLAAVDLPGYIVNSLAEIGIAGASGPVLISGSIPLFGSDDDINLAVEFPEVETDDDALVASGSFAVVLALSTDGTRVEAGVEGELVFRITRPDQQDCFFPGPPPDGTFPTSGECYDELTLTLGASFIFDALTGSVTFELRGEISQWDNAFGLNWLDINQFALTLRFNVEAGGGFTVDIVIAAGIVLDQTDITFAASATFTPAPPWLIIKGITAGTKNGISLPQLADYFGLPTDGLPDLSIRNAWFAWGTEEDTENCIIRGLFISAELHLGAVNDGNVEPGCAGGASALDDLLNGVQDSCADSDTCLAGIRLEVDPDEPRLSGELTITGFTAGPIEFEPTKISLLITPTIQRLTFSAGATLTDPITGSDDEWASGVVEFEIGQNAGVITIVVEAQVTLAEDFFEAYVHGSATGDFSAFAGGDFVAFLDSVEYDLDVELSFPGLEKLAEDIVAGLEKAGDYLEDAGEEIEDFFVNDVGDGIESAVDDVGEFFSDPFGLGGSGSSETDLLDLESLFDLKPGEFKSVVDGIENFIAGIPFVTRENARAAVKPLRDAYNVNNAVLDGEGFTLDFKVYTWTEDIDGGCDTGGEIVGDPICDAAEATATEIADRSIEPTIDEQLDAATGLDVPAGAGDAVDVARDLAEDLTGQQLRVDCLAFDYETPDQADYGADFFGVDIGQGLDYSDGLTVGPASDELNQAGLDLNQDGLDSAVGAGGQTNCAAPTEPPFAAGSTFFISTTEIDEGQSVEVWGSAIAGLGATEFSINWGDGTSDDIQLAEVFTFSRTHTYPDDIGEGPANNVVVSLGSDVVPFVRSHRLTINNVDPVLANLAVSDSEINEGDTVTLTGDLSDVGVEDTHIVEINWGDGNRETLTLALGTTSFSVDHTYRDDDDPATLPSGAQTDYRIRVELIDDDTGIDEGSVTVTVNNVPPGDPELQSVTVGGNDVPTSGDIPLVPEGEESTWIWTVVEPGPDDQLYFVIEWGDGTFSTSAIDPTGQAGTVTITEDPNDPTIKIVTATHTYTNLNNGTVLPMRLEVYDKDTQDDPEFDQTVIIGVDVGTDFACFVSSAGTEFTVTVINPPAGTTDYDVFRAAENGYNELFLASFASPDLSVTFTAPEPGLDQVIVVRTFIPDTPNEFEARCGQIDVDDPNAALAIVKTFTGFVDNDGSTDISTGDHLEYTIVATNTGTVELTNVTVDDDLTGASTTCAGPVAVGGTCELNTTWIVLSNQLGTSIPNVATADSDQTGPVTATELVPVPAPTSAELSIEKTVVGFVDNDGSTDITLGDEINYLIVATNTGLADLTDVVVDDDLTGASTTCGGPVAPGEICELTTSHTVVAGDVGTTILNTAAANSNETDEVTDTAVVPVGTPAIAIDKMFLGYLDNDGSNDISVDDELIYRLTATNSGETGLTSMTLVDDLTNQSIDCVAVRDPHLPGQSCTGTVTYTVTPADLGTTVTNTATADSVQAGPVTDTVEVAIGAAALSIDKEFTGFVDNDNSTTITPGDELQYSIVATNTGTANLTNVVVTDDLTGAFEVCPGPLAPGATCDLTTSYIAQQSDAGTNVVNTATADSDETDPPVTDTVEVPVVGPTGTPALAIDKDFTGFVDNDNSGTITPGDELQYSIVATNTGDVDLTNVTVDDDLTGASTTCPGPVAPGETCDLTTSYIAQQSDAGTNVVNTATADSDETDPPVTDTVEVPVVTVAPVECPATAVSFDDFMLFNRDGRDSVTVPAAIRSGLYQIRLFSSDDIHAAGVQTDQTQEQWRLEMLDASGVVLYTSPAISDLPDALTEMSELVDTAADIPDGVVEFRAQHVRLGTSINSVVPACAELVRLGDGSSGPPAVDLSLQLDDVAQPGTEIKLDGRFASGLAPFTVEIDWGDGTTCVAGVGDCSVLGPALGEPGFIEAAHTYAAADVYTVTVSVTDSLGSTVTASILTAECTILGTNSAETLQGTDGDDVICGLGGNDRLFGNGGNDIIFGGQGNDRIEGRDGDDVVIGGDGRDTIIGGSGADELSGNAGIDTIRGGDDDDLLRGGADDDRLFGESGDDTLLGEEDDDRAVGGDGEDTILGGYGNDRVEGQNDNDTIDGGRGRDIVMGGRGDDALSGGAGNDDVRGGDGNDDLDGGVGVDRLFGEAGDDTIDGGQGDDRAVGGNGNDTIDGGIGNDRLEGQNDDDILNGGQGKDVLLGGNGDDQLSGGTGNDNLNGGGGDDALDGGDGNDRCVGGSGTDTTIACEL